MGIILKPKRGKKTTALAENIKLENGEIFLEFGPGGVGTSAGSIKVGDGVTLYRNLPYFFDKDAYALVANTHTMADVEDLTDTLSVIEGRIENIIDGDITVKKAEDSDRLNGMTSDSFVTPDSAQDLTNKTYNGYTLADAAAKSVDEDVLVEDSSNLPTSKAVSTYVNTKIGEIVQIRYVSVEVLPPTGEIGVIYLVPHQHGINDSKDEYIWTDENKYEKIGNTDIDLSDYALVNHNHSYNNLLDLPTLPTIDNETIVEKDGKWTGSRIKVLSSDPISSTTGDMWVVTV